jgi:hypothetical protein
MYDFDLKELEIPEEKIVIKVQRMSKKRTNFIAIVSQKNEKCFFKSSNNFPKFVNVKEREMPLFVQFETP